VLDGIVQVRRRRLVLVVTAIIFGIGCHRTQSTSTGVNVEFQIKPQPVRVGPVTVSLALNDPAGHPVTGAQISAEADMSHAGMSPVFATTQEVRPGLYESHLSLTMAGDWVVLLHGKLPRGEKLERQFEVRDVRSNR